MLLNRLINEPYLCNSFLTHLLDCSNKNFFNKFNNSSNIEGEFDFLKMKHSKRLTRKDMFQISNSLIEENFFILENDQFEQNQIIRDPELLSFINKNIDIFLFVNLLTLNKEVLTPLDVDFYAEYEDLSVAIQVQWDKYCFTNPKSNLFKSFQNDPRIEHLIRQNKVNQIAFFYNCHD